MEKKFIKAAISKINNSEVCVDPYPHIKIDDFFDKDYFSKIVSELRNLSVINNMNLVDREKYDVDDILNVIKGDQLRQKAPLSFEMNKFLSSHDFFDAITKKIGHYASSSLDVDQSAIEKSVKQKQFGSSINAIMPGKSVKRRGIHLDDVTVGINFLLYVRFEDDFSSGGSLQLLSQEDRLSITSGKMFLGQLLHIYPTDMMTIKSYEYKNNRLFVSSNSQYSLHEVSTRRHAKLPRISFQGALTVDGAKIKNKSNITSKIKSIFK